MHNQPDTTIKHRSGRKFQEFRNNQRGSALILAIGLLAVMSILGATLMSLSTSEIQLSANYRDDRQAFFAADRAIEYAITGAAISGSDVNLYTDTDTGGTFHRTYVEVGQGGLDPDGDNMVEFIGVGTPPVGIGSDANKFQAFNYTISTTGIFPNTAAHPNPSRSRIRAQVAKVVPK